jgi:hypothetical protein
MEPRGAGVGHSEARGDGDDPRQKSVRHGEDGEDEKAERPQGSEREFS